MHRCSKNAKLGKIVESSGEATCDAKKSTLNSYPSLTLRKGSYLSLMEPLDLSYIGKMIVHNTTRGVDGHGMIFINH